MAGFLSIIFIAVFVGCGAAPTGAPNTCAEELEKAGASDAFDAMVAHGIHSMTLDDLKKFDPTATENNYVPTIDLDLRSELAILSYAPDRKTNDSDSFLTDGMKVLDLVLTHLNEKHWDVAGFTPLERVVHALHMREVWAHMKQDYDKIGKTTPAPSPAACQCALDVETNGIMKIMRFVAMALREPGLVYDSPAFRMRKQGDFSSEYYVLNPYQYNFFRHEMFKKSQDVPIKTLLLQNLDDAMPPLKDPASWKIWKGKADPHHRDATLFLYCALDKARAEQK